MATQTVHRQEGWRNLVFFRRRRHPFSPLEENIRNNTLEGVTALVAINLVSPFLGIYALRMGATHTQVGLLSSLPALVSLFLAVPGAALVERREDKQRFTVWLVLLSRFLYLSLALVPLFARPSQPMVLLVFVALMTVPTAVLNVAWQSLIGYAIPADRRADAFASRNLWMTFSGMVAVVAGGYIMDALPYPRGYQAAFSLAVLAGLLEAWFMRNLHVPLAEALPAAVSPAGPAEPVNEAGRSGRREPHSHRDPQSTTGFAPWQNLRREWHRVTANRPYFWFLLATLYFHFVWMGPWPLWTIYRVDFLHANNVWMSVATVAGAVGSMVTFHWWSDFSKRKGNNAALVLAAAGLTVLPAVWVPVRSLWVATIFDFLGGFAGAGVNLALLNRLLEVASHERRTADVAYFNVAVQLAATVAPMLWTAAYDHWGWAVSMGGSSVVRLLAVLGYWLAGTATLGSQTPPPHPAPAPAGSHWEPGVPQPPGRAAEPCCPCAPMPEAKS